MAIDPEITAAIDRIYKADKDAIEAAVHGVEHRVTLVVMTKTETYFATNWGGNYAEHAEAMRRFAGLLDKRGQK